MARRRPSDCSHGRKPDHGQGAKRRRVLAGRLDDDLRRRGGGVGRSGRSRRRVHVHQIRPPTPHQHLKFGDLYGTTPATRVGLTEYSGTDPTAFSAMFAAPGLARDGDRTADGRVGPRMEQLIVPHYDCGRGPADRPTGRLAWGGMALFRGGDDPPTPRSFSPRCRRPTPSDCGSGCSPVAAVPSRSARPRRTRMPGRRWRSSTPRIGWFRCRSEPRSYWPR